MVIDKIKLLNLIKLIFLGFYLVYFIFFNTSLKIYLPHYKNSDSFIKGKIINDSCILLVGGSNVRQGLSAELISESMCPVLNLGINSEMGSFDTYIEWLKENLVGRKYESIIYSPSLIWNQSKIVNKIPYVPQFPEISILNQLKNLNPIHLVCNMVFNC